MKNRYRYNEQRARYEYNLSEKGEDWGALDSVEDTLNYFDRMHGLPEDDVSLMLDAFAREHVKSGYRTLHAVNRHREGEGEIRCHADLCVLTGGGETPPVIVALVTYDLPRRESVAVLASRLCADFEKRRDAK